MLCAHGGFPASHSVMLTGKLPSHHSPCLHGAGAFLPALRPGEAYQCPSHHAQKPRAALRPFRKSFDHSDHRNLDRAGLRMASLFPLTRQSENVYRASRWHTLESRSPAAVLAAEKWFSFCSIRSSSRELR